MQPAARSQTRRRAGLRATQRAASDAPASGGEPGLPSSLPRKISPISESGESALLAQRVYGCTTSSDNASAESASTTTSDPYMALVDELIDKGSDFSFKGTDDELDTRSAVEASLGYEDLGAAEQDMRVRCARGHLPLHTVLSRLLLVQRPLGGVFSPLQDSQQQNAKSMASPGDAWFQDYFLLPGSQKETENWMPFL